MIACAASFPTYLKCQGSYITPVIFSFPFGYLKINPYFVKDYEKAARAFGAWKTMNIITWIRETDARGKGIDADGFV